MRIATLQFAPLVGEVQANIKKADTLLEEAERDGKLDGIELLVLPELAFSGYNYPSLSAIRPYLEPTTSGISTQWATRKAKHLSCIVAVGYPERTVSNPEPVLGHGQTSGVAPGEANPGLEGSLPLSDFEPSYYNALVFVSPEGEVVAHYRKTFLYYTDETWASENTDGFYSGQLLGLPSAAGICMDINPYKFTAPWAAYEFANHCLKSRAKLVVLSMAWLTRLSLEAIESERETPDLNTVGYWVERFSPLLASNNALSVDGEVNDDGKVIVIFANRCGHEGTAPLIGDVSYAGSSCVMEMTRGQGAGSEGTVRIWDILGRGLEGVLVIDTEANAKYALATKKRDTTSEEG